MLTDANEHDQALAAAEKGVEFGPNSLPAHNNLAVVLKEAGQMDRAMEELTAAMKLAPWSAEAHSNRIFCMHFHPDYDAAALLAECKEWNRVHGEPLRREIRAWSNSPDPERRLKIGYVSPDFFAQAEAHYVLPLLESHDARNFEVHGYASVIRPDAVTERVRRACHVWHDILHLSHHEAARKIREDKIDILVDLTMHMRNNRLLIFAQTGAGAGDLAGLSERDGGRGD